MELDLTNPITLLTTHWPMSHNSFHLSTFFAHQLLMLAVLPHVLINGTLLGAWEALMLLSCGQCLSLMFDRHIHLRCSLILRLCHSSFFYLLEYFLLVCYVCLSCLHYCDIIRWALITVSHVFRTRSGLGHYSQASVFPNGCLWLSMIVWGCPRQLFQLKPP